MFKLWAKLIVNHRVVKSIILEKFEKFNPENLFDYVQEIASLLKIATPMVLNKHKQHLYNFNHTKFAPSDFVEDINFDQLVIENAID